MSNLGRYPSGKYFYRWAVPQALRAVARKREIKIALERPIRAITPIHVRTLQQALLQVPRAMPKKVQSLSILEIVARYKDSQVERIIPDTVRKHIGAKQMRYVDENIAGCMLTVYSR